MHANDGDQLNFTLQADNFPTTNLSGVIAVHGYLIDG